MHQVIEVLLSWIVDLLVVKYATAILLGRSPAPPVGVIE
jgi:hypothetical protein